jgi:hypothetical protein
VIRAAVAALALISSAAIPAASARAPAIAFPAGHGWIGVEMPATGIDGAQGLAVRIAIRLGAQHVVERDSANGGFLNPHQDEGVDNDVDVRGAPAIVGGFAADPRLSAAIGGLRRRVGDADSAAADALRLPTIVLSRWTRNERDADAYCVCASPGRLVAFARVAARQRFGPRLLIVLVGDAAALEPVWAGRWGAGTTANVRDAEPSIAIARRKASAADAVLVLADERPPTLWRAAAFSRSFDRAYLQLLGHRDFRSIPADVAPGSVVMIEAPLPRSASRVAFEQRFHAVAGYLPGDAPTRAYAAAQIVAQAGPTRAEIRQALRSHAFSTIVGTLTFDGDGFSMPYPLAVSTPQNIER